jgi:hypothetical protein
LEFERAAQLRDRIEKMRSSLGKKLAEVDAPASKNGRGRRKGGGRVPRPKRSH